MPIESRLFANGKFMLGNLNLNETNPVNRRLRIDAVNASNVSVQTFDEVSMNIRLANNIIANTNAVQLGPTTSNIGATSTTVSAVSPFGVVENVSYVSSTTSLNSFHVLQYISTFGSTEGTFSVFAKADTVRFFSLTMDDQASGGFWAVFDALTGSVVYRAPNGGVIHTAKTTYYGNGWWRCSISGESSGGTLSRRSVNLLSSNLNTLWYDQTTIPSGNGLYIAYWQVEYNTFVSTLRYGTQTPFANNTAMRIESSNSSSNTVDTILYVGSEFDEVNIIL